MITENLSGKKMVLVWGAIVSFMFWQSAFAVIPPGHCSFGKICQASYNQGSLWSKAEADETLKKCAGAVPANCSLSSGQGPYEACSNGTCIMTEYLVYHTRGSPPALPMVGLPPAQLEPIEE